MSTAYVYIRSESNLYTVGFYDPNGEWHAESDWDNTDAAAKRVHYLNGGTEEGRIADAADRMRAALRRLVQATVQRDRQAVLVEARRLRELAETIELGLE